MVYFNTFNNFFDLYGDTHPLDYTSFKVEALRDNAWTLVNTPKRKEVRAQDESDTTTPDWEKLARLQATWEGPYYPNEVAARKALAVIGGEGWQVAPVRKILEEDLRWVPHARALQLYRDFRHLHGF